MENNTYVQHYLPQGKECELYGRKVLFVGTDIIHGQQYARVLVEDAQDPMQRNVGGMNTPEKRLQRPVGVTNTPEKRKHPASIPRSPVNPNLN